MDPTVPMEVLSLHAFEWCARSCVNRTLEQAKLPWKSGFTLSSYHPAPKSRLGPGPGRGAVVHAEQTLAMRDGKRSIGTGTDRDMRSRASSSTDTPPSTDTVSLAPRTNPSKRRRTRDGVSESGGSSSPDTPTRLGGVLFGVPAEVAALIIKHCQPCDFAALCMCCRALHPLIEQALILRSLTLSPILIPTPTPTPTPTSASTLTLTLIPTLILTQP